jgi:hypothetical protein
MPRSDNLTIKTVFSNDVIKTLCQRELTKCDFSIFAHFFTSLCDLNCLWLKNQWMQNFILLLSSTGYSTNSLATVSVGKSSLDSHSHFRQPGEQKIIDCSSRKSENLVRDKRKCFSHFSVILLIMRSSNKA